MSANQDKAVCDYNEFRRTRYFHGMLLDDKDFRDEQNYHAGKRRLLNRLLHGSGIVCGLTACWNDKTGKVDVSSGLALDCCGNEIWVNHKLELSLSQLINGMADTKDKDPCSPPVQPGTKSYRLVICYKETDTDPVSVYLPGAGCDERACENSRTKEGYCFKLVEGEKCPPYQLPAGPCGQSAQCGQPGECPTCACDESCCVILGSLTLDEKGDPRIPEGANAINGACRKYVLTGQLLWQMIGSTLISIPGMDATANDPVQALCMLLSSLKDVQQDIIKIKEQVSSLTTKPEKPVKK